MLKDIPSHELRKYVRDGRRLLRNPKTSGRLGAMVAELIAFYQTELCARQKKWRRQRKRRQRPPQG